MPATVQSFTTDCDCISFKMCYASKTISKRLRNDTGCGKCEGVPVCDRTPEVRAEIVRLVPGVSDCADVTEAHLVEIKGNFFDRDRVQTNIGGFIGEYRLPPPPIEELKTADFSGLSSLEWLELGNNPAVSPTYQHIVGMG